MIDTLSCHYITTTTTKAAYIYLDKAHTNIGIFPHEGAVTADALVPVLEVGHADAVLRGDGVARVARLDKVEGLAVAHHAGLRRGRRDHSVALGRRGRRVVRGADAHIHLSYITMVRMTASVKRKATGFLTPHAGTVLTNARVPFVQLGNGDLVGGQDGAAAGALLDEVESIAVAHHALLDRARGRNAVSRRRGCGLGRRGGTPTSGANTYVDLGPHAGTIATDAGVHGVELGNREAVGGQHSTAGCTLLDEEELVAAVDHALLDRGRGRDAVARRRGCGLDRRGRRGRCGRCGRDGRLGTLDAVGLSSLEIATAH